MSSTPTGTVPNVRRISSNESFPLIVLVVHQICTMRRGSTHNSLSYKGKNRTYVQSIIGATESRLSIDFVCFFSSDIGLPVSLVVHHASFLVPFLTVSGHFTKSGAPYFPMVHSHRRIVMATITSRRRKAGEHAPAGLGADQAPASSSVCRVSDVRQKGLRAVAEDCSLH